MASSSSSDTTEKAKRGRGRPRKQACICGDDLEVEVDGAGRVKHIGSEMKQDLGFALSLCIPNLLLCEWRKRIGLGATYIEQLNGEISGGVVAIHPGCRRLEENLARRAGELSQHITSSSGKCRQKLLDQVVAVGVMKSEVVACQLLLEETNRLNMQMADITEEMASRQEEIGRLKEEVTRLMHQRGSNTGKLFGELSQRQRRRKLGEVKSMAEDALWFMESFGLIPQCITMQTHGRGETVSIPLGDHPSSHSCSTSIPPPPDSNTVMGTLYLLERFGVSDEFYHELTQLHENLPRSYLVKKGRKALSSQVELQRLPAPYDEVYRPVWELLVDVLEREIEKEPCRFDGEELQVKLSGMSNEYKIAVYCKYGGRVLLTNSYTTLVHGYTICNDSRAQADRWVFSNDRYVVELHHSALHELHGAFHQQGVVTEILTTTNLTTDH